MQGDLKLGDRLFSFVNYAAITSLNEHYVMKLMRETGLDCVLPKTEDEEDSEYIVRLQSAIIDTLKLHELLAGYLLPMGKGEPDWDLRMAKQTTRFLQGLTAPEDKAEIQRLALEMVFDFFKQGLALWNASLNSLDQTATQASPKNERIAAH